MMILLQCDAFEVSRYHNDSMPVQSKILGDLVQHRAVMKMMAVIRRLTSVGQNLQHNEQPTFFADNVYAELSPSICSCLASWCSWKRRTSVRPDGHIVLA
jgi:hypothetical protein